MEEGKVNLAQTAADALREEIVMGVLPPGTPLREQSLSLRLNVSRNTLREAFRTLEAQGLIDHRANHGATVRRLTAADVREIYAIRTTLELRGVYCAAQADLARIDALVEAANQLQRAALGGEWDHVGTLSLAVHRRIVQMIGSPRLDDLFSTIAAQARLTFSYERDARAFQLPWVMRDVEICTLICDGKRAEAARALQIYLLESEQRILEIIRARTVRRPDAIFDPDMAREDQTS
ncbi:GntR family transcriptional regulator [uncultured Paracoccus sp.]|uniref:GntR family transcriptional regulator n=1 Tax=uncultured Paracoccus sp. TaxID=189685 RepID=UPI002601B069|nr:GntR family transcriptional regulator [uncultured Paracoccus sp.]